MKKRSLAKTLILFLITFGLYRLFWFASTRRELLKLSPKSKIAHPFILVLPYLLIVLSASLLIFSTIRTGNNISSCTRYDISSQESTNPERCNQNIGLPVILFFYLSMAVFMPIQAYWYWGFCKATEEVSGEKISFILAMIALLLVPDGLDIMIIQDVFNKIPSRTKVLRKQR